MHRRTARDRSAPPGSHAAPGADRPPRRFRWALGVAFLSLAVLVYLWISPWPGTSARRSAVIDAAAAAPTFVGGRACAECHANEAAAWKGSHHDLAMQPASESTVLGRFDSAALTQFGITSTFFRRGGKFFVNTEGADGSLADFEIKYTFGVTPMQQYLIEFPGGRLQALDIAWDTRPAQEGGQRWFHLHPDDPVHAGDVLHWTGPALNWNFMCADCHSTGLEKNWREDKRAYETRWSEINVSCEACHGPGSRHVEWARAPKGTKAAPDALKGLTVGLYREEWPWRLDETKPTAQRVRPRTSHEEIEACARCHARRAALVDPYTPGRPLADTHDPSLLDEGLYFTDGQQQDEVYEYGSFLQSKMYAAGVTCSNCHEPHGVKRTGSPDNYCTACHRPSYFNSPEHHHHQAGSEGTSCVACHMPARNYMVIDARRDHSFRVPRPDVSVAIGTPNACTGCHKDRDDAWAAEQVASWRGPGKPAPVHYGEALHAARAGQTDAERRLSALILDGTQPPIARATALTLLPAYLGPGGSALIERSSTDPDPLVRGAAARTLAALPPAEGLRLATPLLSDPVRSVRLHADWYILGLGGSLRTPEQREIASRAAAEYRAAQLVNQDRAEGQTNLGSLAVIEGDAEAAIARFRRALELNPQFIPARLGLAEVWRRTGRDDEGERELREGLRVNPASPQLHHALGLLLVRRENRDEALSELRRAAELAPDDAEIAYVFGVALNGTGHPGEALAVLDRAHRLRPADRDLLVALATISRDDHQIDRALGYARLLAELSPTDSGVRALVVELEASPR